MIAEGLDRLSAALADERCAILEHDVAGLLRSTQEKLLVLRELETALPAAGDAALEARLRELSQANQANGALLARRRREVNWALRHLGRSESAGAYDMQGRTHAVLASREIAIA